MVEAHMDWRASLRSRFPDWGTPAAVARWSAAAPDVRPGQAVAGAVVARAPFGVWLDIGVGFPALLLVTKMRGAERLPIPFDAYPAVGERVEAWVELVSEAGAIGLTQRHRACRADR